MALAPVFVPVQTAPPARFNLLDTIKPTPIPRGGAYGGIQYQPALCGIARPFTSVCEPGPDLGDISISVDDASVATITSTGLPDGTYRIVWGDGDETASEAEQLNETHDYTTDGDGSYVVQVYSNAGGVYAETTITIEDGVASGPFDAAAVETKVPNDGLVTVVADPFTIYHLFQCRLVGGDDGEARARESLDLGASRAVEEGFQIIFGTGATDITPAAAVDPVKSLGLLEQYAGSVYGGRPVIHMDRLMATRLYEDGAIEREGDHLETGLGSLVVAGAGYNADASLPSAPGATEDWMYATGNVHIWEGKTTSTGMVPQNPYDNEFQALVERVYVPSFECFHAAIKVTE